MNRFCNKKPLAIPVHAVRCTVTILHGEDKQEHTFTALRSRAAELLALLANVHFEKLRIAPALYEFDQLEDLLSLSGPLCPPALSADISEQLPFVSLWNGEAGQVRLVQPTPRIPLDLLMLIKDGDSEDEKALMRHMIVDKALEAMRHPFDALVIYPKDQTEKDEMPFDLDDRFKNFADLFDAVDIDQSGEIVLEELRIVLKRKGYSDDFVEHIFCHLDMNKDYRIKRDEFYEALKIIPKEIFCNDRALSDDQLLRYFDDCDTEKKGEVSWAQFHASLLKRGLSDNFIKTYFSQLDLDDSAVVTRNEYKRCIGLRWKN